MKKVMMSLIMAALISMALNAQDQGAALILDLSGTVEIKLPGASEWAPAVQGQRLTKETLISTGFKSTAVLALGNSTLTVRPLTRLSIEELSANQGQEQTALYLRTGRVRADVNPPPEGKVDFAVRSPSATASVRGTFFEFGTQSLRVTRGSVSYSGIGGQSVLVGAGDSSRVDTSGRVVSSYSAAQRELTPGLPKGSVETGVSAFNTGAPPPVIPVPGTIRGRIEWER
jgi:hypothetical protein